MKLGMFFEMQLPRPWGEHDEATMFANALEWAELGEASGVEYAWAQEHHFLEEYSHSSAPEVFLAAVSQRTTSMRLGHGVALMPPAFNHPARVAERIATLDLVSGGRVEWGTGESSSRIELEGFGVSYIEKRAMWAEAVSETAKMMEATPYPGFEGRFFSLPERNVVPKPVQRPHPPAWVACTSRDTVKLAARLGLGALTFSFMDGREAAFWVEEYYETFKRECVPITRTVNPNIAMLGGFMLHEDHQTAIERGVRDQQFFKWALAWYFRFGTHVPGRQQLWEEFERATVDPMAGLSAIGEPAAARAFFSELEEAGVDQLILLQHAGRQPHDHVCHSLELLRPLTAELRAREEVRQERKRRDLAPYIEQALERREQLGAAAGLPVEAYPVLWAGQGAQQDQFGPRRSLDGNPLWRLHMGARPSRGRDAG